MTRARLIVNPASGTDRAPVLLPQVNARLRSRFDIVDITMSTAPGDVEAAAARALRDGDDALYVAGGDGTLNAALRGLVAAGGPSPAMPVGLIPFGTGNDFAKALGLGEDPLAALEMLLEGRTVDADLGLLNDRPFANTSAGGFVADVSGAVSESLKDRAGKLAYLIGGARALLGSEPFAATLTIDGGPPEWSGEIRMFAVCNARFIGGGYPIAPSACIDDGRLDALVVPKMSTLEFVAVLQRIAAGEEGGAGRVLHFRAPAFDFVFSRPVHVNTDGEVLETAVCRYRVRHKGARFFSGPAPHVLRQGS